MPETNRSLFRANPAGAEIRSADSATPTMFGHLAVFDQWTEIRSSWEGNFMERLAPGSFAKTIRDGGKNVKVLYDHGQGAIGNMPLGSITDLREDATGVYYEVALLSADYVRELIPALRAGLLGASFRFQVVRDDWNENPARSDFNPNRIPERTIRELRMAEFGPVTFPAYTEATAGVRSKSYSMYVPPSQKRDVKPVSQSDRRARLADINAAKGTKAERQAYVAEILGTNGPALIRARNPFHDVEGMISRGRADFRLPDGNEGATLSYASKEMRDAALRAVELMEVREDSHRDSVEKLVRGDAQGCVLERVLRSGSNDYRDGFVKIMTHAEDFPLSTWMQGTTPLTPAQRTAMSVGSVGGGGALVPVTFDSTLLYSGAPTKDSPLRGMADVRRVGTNSGNFVTSAGVSAAWLAEGSAAAQTSPTLARPSIPLVKMAAWVEASYELTEDSDVQNDVAQMFIDARINLEATALTNGLTGSGQPNGVISAIGAVTASRVLSLSAGAFAVGDLYALKNSLGTRFRRNAQWLAGYELARPIRFFFQSSTTLHDSVWAGAGLGQGTPATLLGAPYNETTEIVGTTTTGSLPLLLGDFSRYCIVDHVLSPRVQFEPVVRDVSTGFPNGRSGWFFHAYMGADVVTPEAFRLLQIL